MFNIANNYGVMGIDYSLSSPAACYHPLDIPFSVDNCSWLLVTKDKKQLGYKLDGRIKFITQPENILTDDQSRYSFIAEHFADFAKNTRHVAIEGYAMGATGRVFHIAENTAVLKHLLWKQSTQLDIIPPKTLKKLATGNGNADKNVMYAEWLKQTGIDLFSELGYNKPTKKIGSPISDIVDSWFICKYIYEKVTNL